MRRLSKQVQPPPTTVPEALLHELNRYRASFKLRPLTLDRRLSDAAELHSRYQAAVGVCRHYSDCGGNALNRAFDCGYRPGVVCENVSSGYATPEAVVYAWYRSTPHRLNFLHPKCTLAGIGVHCAGGSRYWTALLVAPEARCVTVSLSGPLIRVGRRRFGGRRIR